VREDLPDLEPGGARRLSDRQIVLAGKETATGGIDSWIELYRELMRAGGAVLRDLDGRRSEGPAGIAQDEKLITSEHRRLRARFRFWAETMGGESPAGGVGV
jgi:hypothetical protein